MINVIKPNKICPLRALLRRLALKRIAKALVLASEKSAVVGDDILYRLPGVFALSVTYQETSVRLIKEANAFRIMKDAEKSVILLSVTITDQAALEELSEKRATWQKVYAEGRITFAGKEKYAALFLRAAAEGDKAILSEKQYRELYGE